MYHVFLLLIPFGLTGAISPMLLTEQTVLLAGHDGPAVAKRFALGAFAAAVIYISALVFLGHAISVPGKPHLSSTLDLLLGTVLIVVALAIRRGLRSGKEPAHRDKPPRKIGRQGALGFGAFSMATNFTTLAIMVPAAKVITASQSGVPNRVLFVVLLALAIAAPVWLPLALHRVAPGPAERSLAGLGNVIENHGRLLATISVGGLGVFLVLYGAFKTLSN
jgi:hypothetical protein